MYILLQHLHKRPLVPRRLRRDGLLWQDFPGSSHHCRDHLVNIPHKIHNTHPINPPPVHREDASGEIITVKGVAFPRAWKNIFRPDII